LLGGVFVFVKGFAQNPGQDGRVLECYRQTAGYLMVVAPSHFIEQLISATELRDVVAQSGRRLDLETLVLYE